MNISGNQQLFYSIFQAIIEAFLATIQSSKLFQKIHIQGAFSELTQLADQIQEEKVLKLTRQENYPNRMRCLRVFRMDHPKLELALDVEFPGGVIDFKIVHLW